MHTSKPLKYTYKRSQANEAHAQIQENKQATCTNTTKLLNLTHKRNRNNKTNAETEPTLQATLAKNKQSN